MRTAAAERPGKQGVDEILRWGARQYRRHLELLYPFLGFGIVSVLLEFRFELLAELFDIDRSLGVTADPDPLRDLFGERIGEAFVPVLEEVLVLLVLGIVSLFVLTLLVFLLAAAIAFLVAADEQRGRERTQVARSLVALRRLPALFVGSLLGGLLIAAGSLFFLVPGLYLATRLALGGPAIVVDGHGPIAGLRASWRRSSGQLLEVFAIALGGTALVSAVGFVPLVGEVISVLILLPIVLLAVGYLYETGGEPTGAQ